MGRRLQLWLGVSACALLGAVTLPLPAFAGMAGGNGQGSSHDHDPDPDGGFQHECGEPGGCAEAGERFESRSADEFGEDEDSADRQLVTPHRPLSGNGGLGGSDSVRGGVNDGGLSGEGGRLGD
ncbi:MAG TPA: hypothetical protein VFE34_22580 [Dongiaceae bacterium]|nr:hypothetical protein [Dongiaceae bacterium]